MIELKYTPIYKEHENAKYPEWFGTKFKINLTIFIDKPGTCGVDVSVQFAELDTGNVTALNITNLNYVISNILNVDDNFSEDDRNWINFNNGDDLMCNRQQMINITHNFIDNVFSPIPFLDSIIEDFLITQQASE